MFSLLLLLVLSNAQADQIVPRWGLEKNIIAYGTGNGERMFSLSYVYDFGPDKNMLLRGQVGGWITKQKERESSPFGSLQWGYRVENIFMGFFVEASIGPGYVRFLDDHSSSHIEIVHDLVWGFMQKGWGIAIDFEHISNAGTVPPNLGRDFLGMCFLIPI